MKNTRKTDAHHLEEFGLYILGEVLTAVKVFVLFAFFVFLLASLIVGIYHVTIYFIFGVIMRSPANL